MKGLLALLAIVAVASAARAADPAAAKDASPVPRVTTIHEEQITAQPVTIADGKLQLKIEPARAIPLDELARVDFGHAPQLAVRWLGQDNHDVAQAKSESGASGIQDMHLQISGLIRNGPLKQVILSQGFYLWKSDTANSKNWKLIVEHTPGSGTADLYAEPLKTDQKDKEFKVTVVYDDGTKSTASAKVESATDNTLKVVAAEGKPALPATGAAQAVVVYLEDGSELSGQLDELGRETLRLKLATGTSVSIPLLRARGVWFESAGDEKAKTQFNERLKAPAGEDTALARAADQSLTEINGQVEQIAEQKLSFTYQERTRTINLARLVGLVFAAHPAAAVTDSPYQVIQLAGGDRLAGVWNGLADENLEVTLPWGEKLLLPASAIASVEFRNGKLAYVSDLEPTTVEEVAYFDRTIPYRRDRSLAGEPLKLKGTEYRKGLAVHSRTMLTYAIDRKYARFKATVGFDESSGKRGRVACRVWGDGRELFAQSDLRADADPQVLDVDVTGVTQLALEIDFGEEENICDRVIWGGARLYRE